MHFKLSDEAIPALGGSTLILLSAARLASRRVRESGLRLMTATTRQRTTLRRLAAATAPEKRKVEWKPMIENGAYEVTQRIESFDAVIKQDLYRKYLLSLSRNLSPISTVSRLDLLKRTVITRILSHPTTWFVFAAYGASASCSRQGIDFGEIDLTAFEGGSVRAVACCILSQPARSSHGGSPTAPPRHSWLIGSHFPCALPFARCRRS